MSSQDKFSHAKLEKCFQKFSAQMAVALAVSGGPDSLALLLLIDRWRRRRLEQEKKAPDLLILTIDHGLRSKALEECQLTVKKARELGYDAKILRWEGPSPQTRIQEMAREIRYQLLAGACHEHGIKTLMTGHHLDDQAETFLMRLARGSGVDGLSAMAPECRRYGVSLVRPLLEFSKNDLLLQIEASGWDYVEDPSNQDERFERVRWREESEALKKLGLTSQMIGLGASRLRRAKMALNEVAESFIAKNVLLSEYGTARLDQLAFLDTPDEIAIRVLSKTLRICGGSQNVPNMAKMELLTQKLKADFATSQTLAGCHIIAKGDFWLVVREIGRLTETKKEIVPGGCMFWDARYIVCADKQASKKIIASPLDDPIELEGLVEEKVFKDIPKEALPSLLVLRHRDEIIAIPAIGFWNREAVSAGLQAKLITSDDGLI